MKLWAWVSRTPATVRCVRKMRSTTVTMSSSRLGKTRRDSCASCWRRGMKCCSVLSSSELPSVSLSKLTTHQFPRLLITRSMSTFATCGSTAAKGLYANLFFVLVHYAFGGVKAPSISLLESSTSTTGSTWRVPPPRGSLLAARLWASPSGSSSRSLFFQTRLYLMRLAASGPVSRLGPLSLLHWVFLLRQVRLSTRSMGSGADGRAFPSVFDSEFGHRVWYVLFLVYMFHGVARFRGGRTCFPITRVRLHVHCCLVLFCRRLPIQHVRAWPGGALFSEWLGSQFFRSSKSGSVVARDLSGKSHWLVLSCFHSLEPMKTSQATPGVSVARLVPWVFSQLTSRGGAGSDSSGM